MDLQLNDDEIRINTPSAYRAAIANFTVEAMLAL